MPYKLKEDQQRNANIRYRAARDQLKVRAATEGLSTTAYIRKRWGAYYACGRLSAYAKRRCKLSGVENTVTGSYLLTLFKEQKGRCALTGVLLKHGQGAVPDTLSLDRIDQSRGYVPGNVRILSWWANTARGSMTDDEFLEWCKKAIRYAGRKRR